MKATKLIAVITKGKDKLWYVALYSAANGKQIWRTGDGYTRRNNAMNALNIIQNAEIQMPNDK